MKLFIGIVITAGLLGCQRHRSNLPALLKVSDEQMKQVVISEPMLSIVMKIEMDSNWHCRYLGPELKLFKIKESPFYLRKETYSVGIPNFVPSIYTIIDTVMGSCFTFAFTDLLIYNDLGVVDSTIIKNSELRFYMNIDSKLTLEKSLSCFISEDTFFKSSFTSNSKKIKVLSFILDTIFNSEGIKRLTKSEFNDAYISKYKHGITYIRQFTKIDTAVALKNIEKVALYLSTPNIAIYKHFGGFFVIHLDYISADSEQRYKLKIDFLNKGNLPIYHGF